MVCDEQLAGLSLGQMVIKLWAGIIIIISPIVYKDILTDCRNVFLN